jgi:outer membrane usher protein
MKNWGRFKAEGSLLAAAIGAVAAGYWTEDEFQGPEPEKPRLSDPDSDALYSNKVDIPAPAAMSGDLPAPAPSISGADADGGKRVAKRSKALQARVAKPLAKLADQDSMAPETLPPPVTVKTAVAPDFRPEPGPITTAPAPTPAPVLGATPQPIQIAPVGIAAAVPIEPAVAKSAIPATPQPASPGTAEPTRLSPSGGAPAPGFSEAPASAEIAAIPATRIRPAAPIRAAAPDLQVATAEPAASPEQTASLPAPAKPAPPVAAPSQVSAAPVATPAASPPPSARSVAKPARARLKAKPAQLAQAAAKPVPALAPPKGASDAGAVKPPPSSLAEIRARLNASGGKQDAQPQPGLPPNSLAEIRTRLEASAAKSSSAAAAIPASVAGQPAELLVLAPMVNGVPVDRIVTVERGADGGFSMRAEDLRALRIKLDPAIGDQDMIALSSLAGLEARTIDATQSLDLNVPDGLLIPTEIFAQRARTAVDLTKINTIPGLLLNYRFFGSDQSGDGRKAQLNGDMELVAMTRLGLFVTNGNFTTTGRKGFVRGDSFWRFEDTANVRTYTMGDLASGAVSFSRSVRLGGIQVQSDFEQRPDLFTGPLPQFAGSAALPSSLDLFVDSVRIFSSKVPQGPFVLRSIPQISGNELRIVTTDLNGRQTEITTAYFNAPGLLRKGLLEYSAELGAPRVDAGVRSFGYRSQLFGSATARYGLGDRLTLEGHIEAGGDLVNGGIGIIQALGRLGSFTASASASSFRGKEGTRLSGQYRFDQRRFSLFANIEREYGDYFDLGDVSSFRGRVTDPTGADLFPRRQRRSVERIGASFRPSFDPLSINVAYNHVRLGNSEIRTANLDLRRRLSNRISFRGNAIFDLERRGDVAVSIGLDIRLGRDVRAFVGGDRSNGRSNYNASVTGFSGNRQNELGYSISQRGNDDDEAFRSASLNYRFPQAFVGGTIDQSGTNVRGTLQVEGALVAAGKDVFVANRIGEGFAIVKNAGPGVDILQAGRKIATANGKGSALLPSLEAFSETRVAIDPATLPAGLEAENGTDFRIVTARRRAALVDFGVRKVNAAIIVVMGPDGKPVAPGTRVDLVGGEAGLMGYDGEVFLKDLKAENRININLGPSGNCSATFAFDVNGEAQPRIGPLSCS